MIDANERHEVFRAVAAAMLDFANDLAQQTQGRYGPADISRLLISAGVLMLAREAGTSAAVDYLRTAASCLDEQRVPSDAN